MRVLNTILAVVVAVLLVLFTVSNPEPVTVEVWPFPFELQLGLYAVILLAVLLGFVAGLITAWLSGGKRRRELRALRRETKDLQASLARANAAASPPPAPKDLPLR